ncbi:glycine betaine transporter OpuD [Gangjinia marincola]|uniref:Glycine betaine transporter OpuD n=2 Tax=Gangjinia marincola TaxID=578463 RepID=A0ABN1MJT8_9FLAO
MAWIAMLYSAGMGAGILLRAVQEPVYMKLNPPIKNGASADVVALEFTFYQWGFTAWAFYALFAICVGYVMFKKGQPALTSTAFNTFLKKKSHQAIIDALAVLTTVFGLSAAIGLGTTQINGGLNFLTGMNSSLWVTIGITLLISIGAFISVYKGIDKGIKVISTVNIYITLGLLLFVLLQSNTANIIQVFVTALYYYFIDFIPMSLAMGNFDPGEAFLTDWTYYYWAFWLAWAPFTGIFIARISKGRTIRELIIGVLLIPSLGTFIWFSTFGSSVFDLMNTMPTYDGEFSNVFSSIFVFLSNYPLSGFINIATMLLLASFLITSLDSAIFVLSMFTDRGNKDPKKSHRYVWSIALTALTIGLLLLGDLRQDIDVLTAVQKLLIITSLPFALLMILMIFLFLRRMLRSKDESRTPDAPAL